MLRLRRRRQSAKGRICRPKTPDEASDGGREINPTATLVPVNDPDAGKTISTEITDIEMKTRGRAA
jgi:hypothetical protein